MSETSRILENDWLKIVERGNVDLAHTFVEADVPFCAKRESLVCGEYDGHRRVVNHYGFADLFKTAIDLGHYELVEYLCRRFTDLTGNSDDISEESGVVATPIDLTQAVQDNNLEIVNLILRHFSSGYSSAYTKFPVTSFFKEDPEVVQIAFFKAIIDKNLQVAKQLFSVIGCQFTPNERSVCAEYAVKALMVDECDFVPSVLESTVCAPMKLAACRIGHMGYLKRMCEDPYAMPFLYKDMCEAFVYGHQDVVEYVTDKMGRSETIRMVHLVKAIRRRSWRTICNMTNFETDLLPKRINLDSRDECILRALVASPDSSSAVNLMRDQFKNGKKILESTYFLSMAATASNAGLVIASLLSRNKPMPTMCTRIVYSYETARMISETYKTLQETKVSSVQAASRRSEREGQLYLDIWHTTRDKFNAKHTNVKVIDVSKSKIAILHPCCIGDDLKMRCHSSCCEAWRDHLLINTVTTDSFEVCKQTFDGLRTYDRYEIPVPNSHKYTKEIVDAGHDVTGLICRWLYTFGDMIQSMNDYADQACRTHDKTRADSMKRIELNVQTYETSASVHAVYHRRTHLYHLMSTYSEDIVSRRVEQAILSGYCKRPDEVRKTLETCLTEQTHAVNSNAMYLNKYKDVFKSALKKCESAKV